MPWERPVPTFDEYDGWRVCDVCGVSWSHKVPAQAFAHAWRKHLYDHMHDQFPCQDDRG
jgi:hypothetical protein